MLARNALPRPCPFDAPRTRPAMSTNDTGAGSDLLRAEDLGQLVQPRVGQPDHADVGLDGGERVVRGEHVVLGQRVEQGALADVGQADDADGETHDGPAYAGPGRAGPGGSDSTPRRWSLVAPTGPRQALLISRFDVPLLEVG